MKIVAMILTASGGLMSIPASAAYIPSKTTLAGGVIGVVNTSTTAISVCWKAGASAGSCQSIGTFANPSISTTIVNSEGANFFYVIDQASGRVVRCEQTGSPTASASGWSCVQVAAGLP